MKIQILTIIALSWATHIFSQTTTEASKPAPKPKTAEQLAYEELFKDCHLRSDSLTAIYKNLTAEEKKSSPALDSLIKKSKEIAAQMQSIRIKYLESHAESVFSLKVIKEIDNGGYVMDASVEEPLFNKLSEKVKDSEEGKAFLVRLEKAKKLAIGQPAPVFTQPDTSGKMISLTDYKGKYVLVDFWASWCAPCRAENPNVLKAYEKYKGQNFTVIGVSMDTEKAKAAWLKAIKDDGMPWAQVSELKGWENTAGVLYDINAIPQNYLIDPSGKIVAKNIRGEQLQVTLAKFLAAK
ncbi:TlpA family protein disulfide reductase [Pinibacter aurantiacus]|uniref:TlpA family protein disulfide reductase n=1 Tax=Pinibacter aurantiacus TaxID=2851599 RepID=A0A9E2S9T2_9BACT|nr:TlpA disulfide reductase family protein [Pinibacter aurantiacus]MBV4357284.1 TlpA family protein disulfide reductase [Pinibacter aurantiacus]